MLVAELMFRVLGDIAPDRVPADSGSMPTWQFYVVGLRRDGGAFSLHQHAFGGMGGRPGRDGLASVSFRYNVRDVSIEWSEMETPLLFERRELRADSGGAGQWRGGLGEELVLRTFADGRLDPARPVVLSGSAGRMRFPPQGTFGGRPGALGVIEVNGRPIAGGDQLAGGGLSPRRREAAAAAGRRRLRQPAGPGPRAGGGRPPERVHHARGRARRVRLRRSRRPMRLGSRA
jgi:N-methylhydantoinase B